MDLRRVFGAAVSGAMIALIALPAAPPKARPFDSPLVLSPSKDERLAQHRPVTIDDLMKLRAIVDVQLAPDGQRVAYVVSTPNLLKNEHEAALYVVPAGGGASTRLGETVRIFNMPTPRPQLRWSPDGAVVSLLGLVAGRPEVFGIPVSGGTPQQLTKAPEGVFGFEWSPDGKSLAFITRDPMSADEERQRQDKSFVIHADAPDRATRLVVQRADTPSVLRLLTPSTEYVDALSWSPDGREIAYSNDRRPARHEHRPALLARRPADRVHLDQRRHRRHGHAQPDRGRGRPARAGASNIHPGRSVGERVRVGAGQPIDLPAGERRHVRTSGAHVRTAGRAAVRRRRPRRASGQRSHRRFFDRRQQRWAARGLQVGRRAGDGRRRGHGRGERSRDEDHRRQSRAARARSRRVETGQMAVVRRHGDLGPAVDADRPAGRPASADAGVRPRRAFSRCRAAARATARRDNG